MQSRPHANRCKRSIFAACTLLCSLVGCTDDFSRFQFGQKKTANAAAQKVSNATAEPESPNLITGGSRASTARDAGPDGSPAQGGQRGIAPADDRDE
jgi:hypothetical protein